MSKKRRRWVTLAALALVLSGCASIESDGGAGEQCNPRLMDCTTPPPPEKTPGCSTLIIDEARAERSTQPTGTASRCTAPVTGSLSRWLTT